GVDVVVALRYAFSESRKVRTSEMRTDVIAESVSKSHNNINTDSKYGVLGRDKCYATRPRRTHNEEKQRRQDDGGQSARGQAQGWQGSREQTESRPKDHEDVRTERLRLDSRRQDPTAGILPAGECYAVRPSATRSVWCVRWRAETAREVTCPS